MKSSTRNIIITILAFIVTILFFRILNHEHFTPSNSNNKPKIAFCFLIYDKLNHPTIWQNFFASADPSKYSIYIHYKDDVSLGEFFDKYKLDNCIPTKWNDISLAKAQYLLYKTAFTNDPNNTKFVILSNSCIPLWNFSTIYDKLTTDNNGYFNATDVKIQSNPMEKYGYSELLKSSQWCILNRNHIQILLEHEAEMDNFVASPTPDEYMFRTIINKYNTENDITTINIDQFPNNQTTFALWNDQTTYKYHTNDFPANKTFSDISSEELDYIKECGSLFARKFAIGCTIDNTRPLTSTDLFL